MNDTEILLVEDNEGDILLTLEAFADLGYSNNINVVRDGDEAIKYINQEEKYNGKPKPSIILLDLNLPKLNGIEVLKYIKSNSFFCPIPVIILTTSSSPRDIQDAYNNYANSYITKPIDFQIFKCIIKSIKNFWIDTVILPQSHDNANIK